MSGNCSETCEEAFFLGAAGTCVTVNNSWAECRCPEGFSGMDDWALYDDCRVNEAVQWGVWIASATLCMFMMALALWGLLHLLVFWDYVNSPLRRMSTFGGTSGGSGFGLSRSAPSQMKLSTSASSMDERAAPVVSRHTRREAKQARQLRRRQMLTLFSVYLLVSYGASALMYYVPFFLGKYRFEKNWYQDLGIALAVNSIFVGLWFFFYVWYIQLPSMRLYAKLFDVNTILVRRPRLVRNATIARVLIINTVNFILLFGWIYVIDDSTETRDLLDSIFLYWSAFLALDFTVWAYMLCRVLLKLFSQLRSLSDEAVAKGITSGTEKKTFMRALNTIILMRRAILALGPVASAVFLCAATIPAVRTRTYLAINFCVLVGNLSALVVLYIFVNRLKGPSARDKRAASMSQSGPAQTGTSGTPRTPRTPRTPGTPGESGGFKDSPVLSPAPYSV